MPDLTDTRRSDAALLAFLVSIVAAALLTILVSALLPGGLVFHARYACAEPVLLTADLLPVTDANLPAARLMCPSADGNYSRYAPGRAVFVSWLAYSGILFLVFFGIFSRKPPRWKKKKR